LLLFHSSLAVSPASQKALCETLEPHRELARPLEDAKVEPIEGTWTDAWRASVNLDIDIPFAAAHERTREETKDVQTIAVAKPLASTLGLTDLSVLDDEQVQLSEVDSRTLCEAANEHLSQDGVSLEFVEANTWLVGVAAQVQSVPSNSSIPSPAPAGHPLPAGEGNIEVLTEHPMFIVGENLRQFLPRGRDARLVERWMNELQMLFFNHPVNVARQANGLPPINFVWLYGFSKADATPMAFELPTTLFSDALKRGDVGAWQAAWAALEPELMKADGVILGDSFPRLKLTFQPAKKSVFSWFTKKPTLGEVLLRLHANSLPPGGEGWGEGLDIS
jgi:hypothetical protein